MLGDVGGQSIWWARQDSNLQPDRYERPALTIELQAPPHAAAFATGNGAGIVYRGGGERAMLRSVPLLPFGARHRRA